MKRLLLLALLALSACGEDHVRFIAPPPERTAEVTAPEIPPATVPCPSDPSQLCNTDEETGRVIGAYDAALAEANRRLAWLRNFFSAVPTKP
jgi:hypothetical protein